MRLSSPLCLPLLCLPLLCLAAQAAASDHDELDATLFAPYRGEQGGAARTFRVVLGQPGLAAARMLPWRLTLADADGRQRKLWQGVQALGGSDVTIDVAWDGRLNGAPAPAGVYRVTLVAGDIEQSWDISVGPLPAVTMPAAPLSLLASSWRVVLGNLHSQTGDSDGGGDLATCKGAQEPQTSILGPTEAYAYADAHGLDVLVTSEHNHLFDGSTGTNANADPASARGLYHNGLLAAARYNAAHPDFLGVYAQEWGVIDHGGHLNIFNSPFLLGWESNGAGALLADIATPKGDYAGLYTLMRKQGWIGQFNHPSSSGQFMVDGVALGYTADGDAAMVLCEVVNTNAFSTSANEGETRHSIYEGACNKALEAGYHVAFSSDQDNHCANWGMSAPNRTGVLLRPGEPLSQRAFIDALRARRVFATMDRTASIQLSANGRMMGSRFSNRGALVLHTQWTSSSGKQVADAVIFEGVPGRNGSVTALVHAPTATITPSPGAHFYYARVTQDDGSMLWSAPVWVTQR